MAEETLRANTRPAKGKQAAKQLRQEGLIPGILYGPGENPVPLTINLKELVNLLHAHGRNTIVNLLIDDDKRNFNAFIYEIQHHPLSGDIIHIDFKHISLKEKVHATVPIRLIGVSVGVKNEGAVLEHILHAVDISCLPTQIPDTIDLDISDLHSGDIVYVKDLPQGDFDYIADPEQAVVHVVVPRGLAIEEEPSEVGPGEPEVIGKEDEE